LAVDSAECQPLVASPPLSSPWRNAVPTYQYSCTECGHFFEAVQSFSEDSLTVCPQCEGRLRKVYNAVGVVFKGSGFYRTDSRSTPEKSANGASNGGSGPSEGNGAKAGDGAKGDGAKGSKGREPAASAPKEKSAPAASSS
jgi:putative FmdB family regulatory protein